MSVSTRMLNLLQDYARHIRSDDASTDEFLAEGMTFLECLELMDHVANAVDRYTEEENKL